MNHDLSVKRGGGGLGKNGQRSTVEPDSEIKLVRVHRASEGTFRVRFLCEIRGVWIGLKNLYGNRFPHTILKVLS